MLFVKSLKRELGSSAGMVFVSLFTIVTTTLLIRILGRAANGRVDTDSVLPLVAFSIVNWLPSLLIIALFIAVLSTLSRAHRDSEMVVWFASGQSLTAWVKPVLSFAIPMIVVITLLAFFVAPWANKKASESKRRFDQREDISQVVAGQFRETNAKDRVFFVESLEKDLTAVKNIFVMQRRNDQQTIVVASNGFCLLYTSDAADDM
jgi:lipopolysaccharide export system permease protein